MAIEWFVVDGDSDGDSDCDNDDELERRGSILVVAPPTALI